MTRIKTRISVDNPNDRPGQSILTIPESFDEDFPQEEREMRVAVGGETLSEAGAGG